MLGEYKDGKLDIDLNKETVDEVLAVVNAKQNFFTVAGVTPVLNGTKERAEFLVVFVNLQTWNSSYLQWKIGSNFVKSFLMGSLE